MKIDGKVLEDTRRHENEVKAQRLTSESGWPHMSGRPAWAHLQVRPASRGGLQPTSTMHLNHCFKAVWSEGCGSPHRAI
jgi:hypothetical protein